MSLVIKKKDFIDGILLFMMYMQLVLFDFLGYSKQLNKVLTVLILLRMLIYTGKQKNELKVMAVVLIVLFSINTIVNLSNTDNIKSNFLMLLYPAVYVFYIAFLSWNRSQFIDSVLKRAFLLLNATMVINLIAIYLQITKPYSIVARGVQEEITYYEDTISGLFGYGLTHVVSLFTVFIILYNLSYRKQMTSKLSRCILNIYIFIITGVSLYFALYNDNKALFLLLPLAVLIYWFAEQETRSKRINRIVVTSCSLAIGLFLIYSLSASARTFIDNNLLNTITMISKSWSLGTKANGSNERVAIVGYALLKKSTWLLGEGFGNSHLYASGYSGFRHFGQSDFGSLLLLGGVWLYVALFFFYLKNMYVIINCKTRNKFLQLGIAIIVLSTAFYTQCFSRTSVAVCLVLISLAFRLQYQIVGNGDNGL